MAPRRPTGVLGAALVLCVCLRCVGGQRRYETAPRSDSAGGGVPWQAPTQDRSRQPTLADRSGETRDSAATGGQVGPKYDPENKRYGGSGRNPYHSASGGYRNRFSGGSVGSDGADRQAEGVGILAGWRDDLQGQRRPESSFLNPYIEVRTRLGPVTGFVVQLYDKPRLPEELWPANLQLELQKHQLNVSTFLGIPYAQAPIAEGRFKVRCPSGH